MLRPSSNPSPRRGAWLGVVALALGVAGCATNPVTGERELIFMSTDDERRVDAEAARQVESQIGLVEDEALTAYVDELGQALAAHSPRQDVRYRFHVVAMDEPNAFALPGGNIYVSRGLLALANDEAQLANVLGHEIGHVAARHAAQRDALLKTMSVLNVLAVIGASVGGPTSGGAPGPAGQPAVFAFSQKQESEADEIGQDLAVLTGIDPMGMATFMRSLDAHTRLQQGFARSTGYFDTHPASRERAAEAATAAEVRQWEDRFRIARTRRDFLERLSGLAVDTPAAEGVVEESRFLHPDLDVALRFPRGWEIQNTHAAVFALSPRRDAALVLELEGEGDDPEAAAMTFARREGVVFDEIGRLEIAGHEAFRARGSMPTAGGRTNADVTWIAHDGLVFRLSGFSRAGGASRWDGVFRSFPRSFRRLSEEERASISERRLLIVEAREGETLAELGERTGNSWELNETAVMNQLRVDAPLMEGQPIKVAVRVPYRPLRERPRAEPQRRAAEDAATQPSGEPAAEPIRAQDRGVPAEPPRIATPHRD